jgi:hypothetical protein
MVLELSLKRGRQADKCEKDANEDSVKTNVEIIAATLSKIAEKRRLQVIK